MATILEEINEQMQALLDTKAAALKEIEEKITEARQELADAEEELKAATEEMNLKSYQKAEKQKADAQSKINMYSGRYKQIAGREYITEEESDKVIDKLLNYEKEIAANFKAEYCKKLQELKSFYNDYITEVRETEKTINKWGASIKPNFNTRGRTTWTDPATGLQTTRSKTPVPVHNLPYEGSEESKQLAKFLQDCKDKKIL